MDFVEHGGVEELAGPVAAAPVAGSTTRREPEGEVHHVLPVVEAPAEYALARLDGAQLGTDMLLFVPEHGDVDRVGVVGLHQLVALGFQALVLGGQELPLGGRVLVGGGHLVGDRLAQPFGPVGRDLDAAVEILDLGFEVVDGDVALLAAVAVPSVLLPHVVEVSVGAFRVLDRHAPPAHAAHEKALQVVVPPLARAAHGTGGEQLLDLVEGGPVDERLMAPLVGDAVPLDDADICTMGEQVRHARHGERPGRVAIVAPPVAKPSVRHLLGQALDGPLSGGVQFEGGPHERGALGVADDVGHLAPADRLADVQVPEGRLVGVAAELRLPAHALPDLRRQVGRVELGHEGVYDFDEATRGGLVEALGHRDERHAAPAQERTDGDVVLHVPNEAVDLVDDDGLYVAVLCDARQHGPQPWPVGRPGRLALVHVLVDELSAFVADAPDARLALGGDGEPLFGEVLLGLVLGRDPQVDHATHREPPLPSGP